MTKISRRGFLRLAGATVAVATLGSAVDLLTPKEVLLPDNYDPLSPNYHIPQALVELRNPEVLVAQGWLPIRVEEDYKFYRLWLEATKELNFSRVIINGPRSVPIKVRQTLRDEVFLQEGDTFEMIVDQMRYN